MTRIIETLTLLEREYKNKGSLQQRIKNVIIYYYSCVPLGWSRWLWSTAPQSQTAPYRRNCPQCQAL